MRPKPNGNQHGRPLGVPSGKMPKDQGANPISHTPLACPTSKMPKTHQGGTARDPMKG